ncbi:MAG: hypothetical protein IJY70_02975, partial [Clostridia bacterium]|nr:hypothetical protein [Clostridia bacterium]
GIQIGDTEGFVVRDIYFDYNWRYGCTDGVHINGPAKNGVIENLCGTTNDDMVSLTPADEQHAEVTCGEISNVDIRNVTAKNGYSGVRLLSCSNFAIKNITVSGVYGDYRHNAVLISHHYTTPDTRNFFDNIIVEKVFASKSKTPLSSDCFTLWEDGAENLPLVWLYNDINVPNLTLRDIVRTVETNTGVPLIKIEDDVKIARLVLDNISQNIIGNAEAPIVSVGVGVKEIKKVNMD